MAEALAGLSGFEAWRLLDAGDDVLSPGLARTASALLATARCLHCPRAELLLPPVEPSPLVRRQPLTSAVGTAKAQAARGPSYAGGRRDAHPGISSRVEAPLRLFSDSSLGAPTMAKFNWKHCKWLSTKERTELGGETSLGSKRRDRWLWPVSPGLGSWVVGIEAPGSSWGVMWFLASCQGLNSTRDWKPRACGLAVSERAPRGT